MERTANLVGVRFSPTGRVNYFEPGDDELAVGDIVIVESEEGPREARVAIAPGQVLYSEIRGPLLPLLRKVEPDRAPPHDG
jgi:cell fate regulator YaaT (PSP1 superfamily)